MLAEPTTNKMPKPMPNSRQDGYEAFLESVKTRALDVSSRVGRNLFTTDASGLFDAFLAALPDDARRHYTCNSCKHFFNHFGGLVAIKDNGNQVSLAWSDAQKTPEFFGDAVYKLHEIVSRAKVTGVFYAKETILGIPVTGEWHHIHCANPSVFSNVLKPPHQVSADNTQEYRMLKIALAEYPASVIDNALTLLQSGNLYRPERVQPIAQWVKELHGKLAGAKGAQKDNIVWLAVATAPAGFAHFKSGVLGTLLDDIKAELPFASIKARFDSKMDAAQYQRAQAAPSVGNIQQAERVVAELGIAPSLARRYATLEEIETIWKPSPKREAQSAGGVFSGVAAKQKAKPVPSVTAPASVMTWAKFSQNVLPAAKRIEAQIPTDSNRFAALVTAQHADAPNILQWDNPFSWYYHNGIDAEMRRRVIEASGQYDNVDIRATLIWNDYNDLDLHCITPHGQHIFYNSREERGGNGWLDVDANGGRPTTRTPVENIRWPTGTARAGYYRFYVHYYSRHEPHYNPTPYAVELEVGGRVYRVEGVMSLGDDREREAFEFDYIPGQEPRITAQSVGTRPSGWNVAPGEFVDVAGIALSPNLWGNNPQPRHGTHTFFLLAGCRDESEGKGRGLFVETLRSDLREIRSTLEAYIAQDAIAGKETATACGLGMSNNAPWNLRLRVTGETGAAEYLIDRLD